MKIIDVNYMAGNYGGAQRLTDPTSLSGFTKHPAKRCLERFLFSQNRILVSKSGVF
jgi:hypothetical protein